MPSSSAISRFDFDWPTDSKTRCSIGVRRESTLFSSTLIRVEEPWYQYFPLDLFFDLLWPGTIKDNQVFFIELEPAPKYEPADRAEILERAGKLRNETLGSGG